MPAVFLSPSSPTSAVAVAVAMVVEAATGEAVDSVVAVDSHPAVTADFPEEGAALTAVVPQEAGENYD